MTVDRLTFNFCLIYFLPYGFISAELGAAIGDEGGIFAWVNRAFGRRWAIRSSWYYWINVALWMPSVFIAFSSTLSYTFFGNQLTLWTQIGIAISLIFLTTCFNFLSIDKLKWLPNLSSIAKLIVTIALIGAGIVWLVQNRSVSTPVLDPTLVLFLVDPKAWCFLPVIIYNLSGFELSSNTSSEMDNPSRAIPKSIIIAGLTTIIAYVLGTAAVNIVLDVKEIDISNGLIDTIKTAFNLPWIVEIIALFLLFTFFGNMITWTAGANRTIIESAQSGAFPALFASRIRATNGPLWSSIITGLVSTLVVLLAGSLSSDGKISDLFWSIYAFSAVVFLLPYLLIFPAYLKLRIREPDLARPFKIRVRSEFKLSLAFYRH
ncbi:APC family permease [Mycoplasma sp. ATU-Cv-508]|uniref:APC family permease n=1 Tax=Mycoplasma sp. ATU-Cv-508 TaxID=2048001 RepID=UPI001F44700F